MHITRDRRAGYLREGGLRMARAREVERRIKRAAHRYGALE
jgi:hypothetical protein